MVPIERLESAIELAEALKSPSLTVTQTLCEIYRIAMRGFADAESIYW